MKSLAWKNIRNLLPLCQMLASDRRPPPWPLPHYSSAALPPSRCPVIHGTAAEPSRWHLSTFLMASIPDHYFLKANGSRRPHRVLWIEAAYIPKWPQVRSLAESRVKFMEEMDMLLLPFRLIRVSCGPDWWSSPAKVLVVSFTSFWSFVWCLSYRLFLSLPSYRTCLPGECGVSLTGVPCTGIFWYSDSFCVNKWLTSQ